MIRAITLLCLAIGLAPLAQGSQPPTAEQTLTTATFDQAIGNSLPAQVSFTNDEGRSVTLGALADGRPLVLVMSWFECPHLCPMLLDELASTSASLPFGPGEYRVATISIDPEEGVAEARAVRERLMQNHGQVVSGWQFLTGGHKAISKVAAEVGFNYAYDQEQDSFAHPAGYVVVSPDGTISRYLMSLKPNGPDLKLALLEASEGKLGSPVDQVVLRCYRFNDESGQYNLAVMRLVQVAGGMFILAMVLLVWLAGRRRRHGE